jgi:hypothetical protein
MEPVLVKEIVVAHAGMNFKNGAQEFDLTTEDMDAMVTNFAALKRQVPVLFRGPHLMGPERADRPADGWVEDIYRKGMDLIARVKLMGEAAAAVLADTFRGASIGAFSGRDLHGKPVGWVLDHLLITNTPFFSDLNIAAQRNKGGEAVIYLTAQKEAAMSEPNTEQILAKAEADHEAAIKAKDNEVVQLKAEILSLREQLDNVTKDPEKDEALTRLALTERKLEAMDIRELVFNGLQRGTLKAAWCSNYNKGGHEGTLSWFKASRFGGDLKLLKYQVEQTDPVVRLNQTFASGAPAEGPVAQLSSEDKDWLRSRGIDPEKVTVAAKARDLGEYRRLKAAAKGN